MKKLLTKLKMLRIHKKLSQRGLSEALHISQTSVSKYERGVCEPDINMLIKISDFFEISIDELVRINEEPTDESDENSDEETTEPTE